MDLSNQIKQWYKGGKDFFVGVSLYMQSPKKNKRLLRRFSDKGADLYNIGKLEFLLLQQLPIGYNLEDDEGEKVEGTQERRTIQQKKPLDFSILPESIKDNYLKKSKLYRERDFHHSQLELMKTDEERFEAAQKIIDLQYKIDDVWRLLDKFRDEGIVPPVISSTFRSKDIMELMTRQSTVKTYISKYTKQIKQDPTNRNFKKWEVKLEAFKQELKEINERIETNKG